MNKIKETNKTNEMSEASAPARRREKKRITYVVRGLMEFQVRVPSGYKNCPDLDIRFEGGQISGYGVKPASLTTEDPILQEIIERSLPFRQGRIERLDSEKEKAW